MIFLFWLDWDVSISTFLSFFAGVLSTSEKEEEEQCMWKHHHFGLGMIIFNLVFEVLKFCIQVPDLLISNVNTFKIKLKANGSKLSYNIHNIRMYYLKDLSNMYFWSEVNANCTHFFFLLSFFPLDFTL